MGKFHVITGAFGYSGRYIAARLLAAGVEVRTVTNSYERHNPFGGQVAASPLCFDQPDRLVEALEGAEVLYNTYWVRFNHRGAGFTHHAAVDNTRVLFEAARRAGVERVVHVSITNPDEDSELEYFNGKARLERALAESGLSHAILRPTVLFGREDILVNNIAWVLRRLPLFGVFGDGSYRLQPIHVDDLAQIAVREGSRRDNVVIDAIGPETFTYRGLVETIGSIIGRPRPVVALPPWLAYWVGWLVGKLKGDVTITREEIRGLMQGRLHVESPPAGHTRLTDWVREHRDRLGLHYASELVRRRDRRRSYDELSSS